jgi:hypothetical protein
VIQTIGYVIPYVIPMVNNGVTSHGAVHGPGFKSVELTIKYANVAPQRLRKRLEIVVPARACVNATEKPASGASLRQQTDALCL